MVKGTSRKHFFTGRIKQPMSPSKKYAEQATPITEDSQEYYMTGMSQKYRSFKSVLSKRGGDPDTTQQSFNSLGGLLLSQSSQSSLDDK